jgi:hypothetical protein
MAARRPDRTHAVMPVRFLDQAGAARPVDRAAPHRSADRAQPAPSIDDPRATRSRSRGPRRRPAMRSSAAPPVSPAITFRELGLPDALDMARWRRITTPWPIQAATLRD